MWSRWLVTVRIEMNSRAPISRLVRPAATNSATSQLSGGERAIRRTGPVPRSPGRRDRLDASDEPRRARLAGDLEGGAETGIVDRAEIGLRRVDGSLGLFEAPSQTLENVGRSQQLDCRVG